MFERNLIIVVQSNFRVVNCKELQPVIQMSKCQYSFRMPGLLWAVTSRTLSIKLFGVLPWAVDLTICGLMYSYCSFSSSVRWETINTTSPSEMSAIVRKFKWVYLSHDACFQENVQNVDFPLANSCIYSQIFDSKVAWNCFCLKCLIGWMPNLNMQMR